MAEDQNKIIQLLQPFKQEFNDQQTQKRNVTTPTQVSSKSTQNMLINDDKSQSMTRISQSKSIQDLNESSQHYTTNLRSPFTPKVKQIVAQFRRNNSIYQNLHKIEREKTEKIQQKELENFIQLQLNLKYKEHQNLMDQLQIKLNEQKQQQLQKTNEKINQRNILTEKDQNKKPTHDIIVIEDDENDNKQGKEDISHNKENDGSLNKTNENQTDQLIDDFVDGMDEDEVDELLFDLQQYRIYDDQGINITKKKRNRNEDNQDQSDEIIEELDLNDQNKLNSAVKGLKQ